MENKGVLKLKMFNIKIYGNDTTFSLLGPLTESRKFRKLPENNIH
jgi:hypothetical protein